MPESSHTSHRTCPNCGHALTGEYCPSCGQHAVDLDVPLGKFLAEFFRESFALDSKLFRTLKPLLLKPGFLTQEYLAGRRARYVPPIRLYLVLSVILFILLAWSAPPAAVRTDVSEGDGVITFNRSVTDSTTAGEEAVARGGEDATADTASSDEGVASDSTFQQRLTASLTRAAENPDRFTQAFLDRMAQVVFVLLPAFALLLKTLYHRRLYVHHLIFSVYFHSFTFAVLIVANLIELAGFDTLSDNLMLVIPAYLLLGMKRVYAQGWPPTILKWGALGMAHLSVLMVTFFGVLAVTLLFF